VYPVEHEQDERRVVDPPANVPATFGLLPAVLSALAGAWIAAGSTGLLAHPLRRILVLVALGIALLVPGVGTRRPKLRILLTPFVACVVIAMVALTSPAAGVTAAAVVLAFLAWASDEQCENVLRTGAVAIAAYGLYVFARTAIPSVWQLADVVGRAVGSLAGAVARRPLHVGATFAGVDFPVVTSAFWALYLVHTKPPRVARATYGFVAIVVGHVIHLVALAYVPDVLAAIPQSADQSVRLATFLHKALPWNAPLLACAIHLLLVGTMLRWTAWASPTGTPPADRPARSAWTQLALASAASALAILLPIATMLSTRPLSVEGKKIVFYERGFLNWLKPTHDSYGRLSSGMYGMLPVFVESLGARSVVSPDLSEADLADADVLMLIFPDESWADGQLHRIHDFVRRGGSLLVMGEHTTGGADGDNRFNDVLAPASMRVRFDSATFAVGGWLHSYETLAHPTTMGIADDRNEFGVVIGASIAARWPARPLLVGRWGFSDAGDEASAQAMMGNSRYDPGEKLGDIVLAAEQSVGKGRVIAFGDTSGFSNAINVSSHVFTSRLLAYLAGGPSAQPMWRQLAGMLIALLLAVLLCLHSSAGKTALVALGLAASATICIHASAAAAKPLPDGRRTNTNNLAYIDASHLEAFSGESWRPDGVGGLALTLMRSGYLTLSLPRLTPERLERAGLLVSVAPTCAFSRDEIQTIADFIRDGGTFVMTVGRDRIGPSLPLLRELGFEPEQTGSPEPMPLGHFKSPYLESAGRRVYVRFHAAWSVRCADPNARVIAYGRDNQPVIILRRIGAGKAVLIGDTCFAMNKNLEWESGEPFEGLRENADFWRWFLTALRDEPMWLPEAVREQPVAGASSEEVTP
jgi:hypothetical protein